MLLLDGPMGTELAARGVATPAPGWSAYALETAPEVVRAIHADYARAGAAIARANTFRTQPKLFPDRYRAITRIALDLARSTGLRVVGCLAPIEDCYRPDLAPADPRQLHRAMAEALAGADVILCETFPSGREACVAVEEAVRVGRPTWVSLTAGPDGSLMTPEAMEHAARACVRAGASAVLASCTGADRTLPYVERLARVGVPFGAYANAGDDFGAASDDAVQRYLEHAAAWIAAGATIVGSCCGTHPAHIAAMEARFVPRV
jgi:S-methylmethionine-dependent homocysteine/selenocysteine methylase